MKNPVLPAAEFVPELAVGFPHFAAEILAGLAQLPLHVLAGATEILPGLPSCPAEIVAGPAHFGSALVTGRAVDATRRCQAQDQRERT